MPCNGQLLQADIKQGHKYETKYRENHMLDWNVLGDIGNTKLTK